MTSMRTLLLLRHAEARELAPGRRDSSRELTDRGRAQAESAGRRLRAAGVVVDHTICSSAARTRQTVDELAVGGSMDVTDALYNTGSDNILELIRELPDSVQVALAVGHAPAIPGLARELADPGSSDAAALELLNRRFPPATLAMFAFDGSWRDLVSARLTEVWLAH
ncbi:MAG TPA: histidine phosphatase family protein [Propionibacteriaceae bacterium]|nr:histidine phosphatase family protein [Propionibacteriaceae bacterium]